jgi:hypothetical protein
MKKKSTSKSAFFNPRALIGFGLCLIGLLLALLAYTAYPGASLLAQKPSQQMAQQPAWQPHWQVVADSHHDLSPPLRELALLPVPPSRKHEGPENPRIPFNHAGTDRPDPVVQRKFLKPLGANIPSPILNFDGIAHNQTCDCRPPDTNGYVGATQYVQIVNESFQVYNKFNGAPILIMPMSIQSIWAGFGGACQTSGLGDPIVLYDKLADRWVITQFAFTPSQALINVPTHECIAISTTRGINSSTTFNRYDFDLSVFGNNYYDYPKLATWPDGYYMADNVFDSSGTTYLGTQPFAFDRTKMLCNLTATVISPGLVGSPRNMEDPIIPSDFDGTVLPPPGAPNSFVEFPDLAGNNLGTYRTWHYHVDFANPTNSTFTQFAAPTAACYTFLCPPMGDIPGVAYCVPQLGTTTTLEANGDRLMYRLAYRNFRTPSAPNESTVGNFSVSTGGMAGVAAPRWFELKNITSGLETINQEGTYGPDFTWRWMGSAAMDHLGDLAVGYSASSSSINPQIRYAGRLSTDPLGILAQGEAPLYAGMGSQTTAGRWGDYSAMTVDPVDDTTMWYTNEYYVTNSSNDWKTRIGNFRINPNQPLVNVSAKSELNHGSAGPFAIDLPLWAGAAGPGRGVECRNASGGGYTIVFNFTNPITAVGGVTSTCGTATAAIGTDNHQVLVSLSAGSCNVQYITVQLNNVWDGTNTISPAVTFGLLIGDTNGNGTVNSSDVAQTTSQSGMAACPPNFRTDVNVDGNINSSDVTLVKSNVGKTLPTLPP